MNDRDRYLSTQQRIEKRRNEDIATARRWFVMIMGGIMILIVIWDLLFGRLAEAAEKRWFLSEVQFQISPDCSHDIQLFSRRAAAKLSTHSVKFTEGVDAVYVSCEYANPFQNAISYLPLGVESQDEELTLGVTRTTWYTETLQIFRAHIWIDPLFAPIFNLEGVILHEWLHALGEPHVEGGIMAAQAEGNHIDSYTIARLRKRYGKVEASVIDTEGNFYIRCLFVPRVLASLVGASEGFYYVITKGGEITEFGPTDCN